MYKESFRIFFLVCLITSLFSCATRQKYVDQQKAFIGKSINEYIKQFGYPNETMHVTPDPNIETYAYVRVAVNPNTPAYAGSALNSIMLANRDPRFTQFGALKCTTWVSFNKKTKIIKNITFRGNYCAIS